MGKKSVFFAALWVVCGFGMVIFSFVKGQAPDQVTYVGGVIGVIGVLQSIRCFLYFTNAEYREKIDISKNDERNTYITNKAWTWAVYCYVIIMIISMMVQLLLGMDSYRIVLVCLCVILVLFGSFYLFLNRKY